MAVATVSDIDPTSLKAAGKSVVLLDVDNTLMPWRGEKMPEASVSWVEALKREGIRVCILSNTRRVERLTRIAAQLGVEFIRGKFKPSPRMYHQALERFDAKPAEAVMVGDQLFTDVWGANRAGIESIWVQPIARREFVGTKVSRLGESVVRGALYKALKETKR